MKKILLLSIALTMAVLNTTAEDIIQITPFTTYAGYTDGDDDVSCLEVQMINDTYEYVGNLQFDMLLPEGITYVDADLDTERIPSKTTRRSTTYGFTLFSPTYQKSTGYTRYLFVPQGIDGEIKPITGQSGPIMHIYFSVDKNMKPGIYPILIMGTVLSKTAIIDMKPVASASYIVVKASADAPSPLETWADIDLSGMTNYIPSFVVDSLNAALSRNTSLRTVNLSAATDFGHELQVPQNVVYRTAATGGLNRAFEAGKKATVCLPFSLPKEATDTLGRFFRYGGLKEGTSNVVIMNEVTGGLDANVPYIFEPKKDMSGIGFSRDTTCVVTSAVSEGETFLFNGNYEYRQLAADDADANSIYSLADNGTTTINGVEFSNAIFAKVAVGNSISPFQAYLKYDGEGKDTTLESINIEWVLADGTVVTAIRTVNTAKESSAKGWYTIDGKKLSSKPTQKGMYIHNGKKRVIAD